MGGTVVKTAAPTDPYQSLLPNGSAATPIAAQFGNTTVTQTGGGNTSQTGGNSATANVSGITDTTNMDAKSLAALQALIGTLQNGGTAEIQQEAAKRRQTQAMVEQLMAQVSTGQAMSDAQSAIALSLQNAMQQQMPAIAKAIEGAGTSASSMQGLLSQKAAADASLAAGALGAQQAQVYAQQRSNLAATLEALTRPTAQATSSLIAALNTAKGAVSTVKNTGTQTQTGSNFSNTITAPQTTTATTTPNSFFSPSTTTPLAPTSSAGTGMDWTQAMAASRDATTGNVDWVKAASLLG